MKILFYADGHSPITLNWLRYWLERGDEVHLVSSYPCQPVPRLASFQVVPVAFSSTRTSSISASPKKGWLWGAGNLRLRHWFRQILGPSTVPSAGRSLARVVRLIQPDLVHALRIPYEGMTAAAAGLEVPLLVSVWGNDFTLHAPASPWMGTWTRRAMQAADALHADCQRDVRIAQEWGFNKTLPAIVTPGNGGIDPSIFYRPAEPVLQPIVINPRGFRSYVRNDTFFRSIPLVLKHIPQARFLCPSMAGESVAENWVSRLGITHAVQLLPGCSHHQMGDLFRSAAVLVSPSTHDGTPNTVLEGMACGCFPIAGNLESLQEWITPGKNGMLVDPYDARSLADATLTALTDPGLRSAAAQVNATLISERADYAQCMARMQVFYQQLIAK